MKTINIPWGEWYEEIELSLPIPDRWQMHTTSMKGPFNLSEEEIKKAFANPIGTKKIEDLARGKKNVVIVTDDLTRPTPTYKFMPFILEELWKAGVKEENITIIMAIGAHKPMERSELIKKLGQETVNRIRVYNHFPYENLVYIGDSLRGYPIKVNKMYYDADLRISVGSIMPHPTAGFGGGGKIVMPGVSSIEVIRRSHQPAHVGETGGYLECEENTFREEAEEVAAKADLDVIVNVVLRSREEIAGVFVGDMVKAHREGVKLAQKVYASEVYFDKVDIAIANCYPVDLDIIQMQKALNCFGAGKENLVREGGAIVITTAASQGRGTHFLSDVGMSLYMPTPDFAHCGTILKGKENLIFTSNLSWYDVADFLPNATLFKRWDDVVKNLQELYGKEPVVGLFPTAPLQILK